MGGGAERLLGIRGLLCVAAPYLRAHWKLTLLTLITVSPQVGFTVGYPLIIRRLVDEAIPGTTRRWSRR